MAGGLKSVFFRVLFACFSFSFSFFLSKIFFLFFGHPLQKKNLSFFVDTGWYKSNFSYAEPVRWGYKQGTKIRQKKSNFFSKGCPFATQKCSTWGSPYFCTNIAKIGKDRVCTADRYAYGKKSKKKE